MSNIARTIITSTDDSNVDVLTAPAGYIYEIMWAYVEYTSTATAGNRLLSMQVVNSSSVVVEKSEAGAVQAASNTYYYNFCRGVAREDAISNNTLTVPFPLGLSLISGDTLRIKDANEIAPAADDMVITAQYKIIDTVNARQIK